MAKRRHSSLGSSNTSLVRTIISTDEDHQIENSDDITIATKPCTVKMPRHPYVGEVCQIVADKFKKECDKKLHIHGGEYPINGGNIELSEGSTVTLTFTVHKEWVHDRKSSVKASQPLPEPLTALHADYVLVGLGTAGAPLARFLSEDMKTSVIVLEAGEDHSTDPQILNGFLFGDETLSNDPRFSYARAADASNINLGLGGTSDYADGRMWGGSSGHNGMVAVRSTPSVYDAWGIISPQWSYNNLLPLMKFLETYTPNGTVADPTQRGFSGPLFITQDSPLGPNHFYSDMSTATNAPQISDYNDPTLGDVAIAAGQWFKTPTNPQIRAWSQSAFLPASVLAIDAKGNGKGVGKRKLHVMSRSTAVELIFEKSEKDKKGPKVIGVRYANKNSPEKVLEVFATKKVILCAGTIANAQLLQLSGIGPTAVLSALGIPVVLANDNVGANMQNHYGPLGLIAQDLTSPIPPFVGGGNYIDLSGNVGDPKGIGGSGYDLTAGGPGVPAAQIQPNDSVRRAQLQSITFPFGFVNQSTLALGVQSIPSVGFVDFNFIPKTLGVVKIISKDPLTNPNIAFNYYKDTVEPTDMTRTLAMYKVMANIAQQYGTTMLYPPKAHYPAPYGTAPDDSLLTQDALNVTLIAANHACGTCRMAPTAATGVVDGNLDVFGVKGLACCDNSVVPTITTGNTAYPAYVLGLQKAKIEGAATPF